MSPVMPGRLPTETRKAILADAKRQGLTLRRLPVPRHRLSGKVAEGAAEPEMKPLRIRANGQHGHRGPWIPTPFAGAYTDLPWKGSRKRAYRKAAKRRAQEARRD